MDSFEQARLDFDDDRSMIEDFDCKKTDLEQNSLVGDLILRSIYDRSTLFEIFLNDVDSL